MAKKIFIADDDPSIVESLTLILEEFGYHVTSTVDGKKVYAIGGSLPDLMLLDIWMSGEDGREICKHLKRQEETKKIPVILISASHDIKKSADYAGADDFIAKPFSMDELLLKIEKHSPTVS